MSIPQDRMATSPSEPQALYIMVRGTNNDYLDMGTGNSSCAQGTE